MSSTARKAAAAERTTRVVRVRVKDKHAAWLAELARDVNTVWNFCNELQQKVFARERKFLSGFDFWPYLKGSTLGECALQLPVQAVQDTAERYAKSRSQAKKVRLAWRKSRGTRRSLGWIPFKVRTIKFAHGQIYFAGRWLSIWDSWDLAQFELRAGNFSEDARGRWYLNITVDRPELVGPPSPRREAVGIDLGLKEFATLSNGEKLGMKRFYREIESDLGVAQRARKKKRVRALHVKAANRRNNWLHEISTALVRKHGAIFVGNVNSQALAKTRLAKSVLDAGWSTFRTMLQYKCEHAGIWFEEVSEAHTTQTCSVCKSRTGPSGREGLGIREWACSYCGTIHDRDVNAAKNILAVGHGRLVVGIPVL